MPLSGDSGRRLGCLSVHDVWMKDDVELLAAAMAGGMVFDCRYDYSQQSFEYVLLHPAFKVIAHGESAADHRYYVAWQGSRIVFTDHRPETISFECPSKKQAESWLKTMQKMQREWPLRTFLPVYP